MNVEKGTGSERSANLGNVGKIPEAWRNHGIKNPVAACRLQTGDLRKLYRLMTKWQNSYREQVVPLLARQPTESEEQFMDRYNRVHRAFVASVTIATVNGVNADWK
jgi:hypothetical protein